MMENPSRLVLFSVVMFVSGCYSSHTINEQAPYADLHPKAVEKPYTDLTAYFMPSRCSIDGEEIECVAKPGAVSPLIDNFKRANIFTDIKEGEPKSSDIEPVKLLYSVSLNQNKHESTNTAKQAAWVFSLLLLMPFLPNEYDADQELMLDIVRWDGKVKHYSARSTGSTKYTKGHERAPMDLDNKLGVSNMNSLTNQLAQDAAVLSEWLNKN